MWYHSGMTTRTITATAPDGTEVSVNVGAKRAVGAIRITDALASGGWGDGSRWLVTVHKTLPNAITGPNQTPAWNRFPRWAAPVAEGDAVGGWLPASK